MNPQLQSSPAFSIPPRCFMFSLCIVFRRDLEVASTWIADHANLSSLFGFAGLHHGATRNGIQSRPVQRVSYRRHWHWLLWRLNHLKHPNELGLQPVVSVLACWSFRRLLNELPVSLTFHCVIHLRFMFTCSRLPSSITQFTFSLFVVSDLDFGTLPSELWLQSRTSHRPFFEGDVDPKIDVFQGIQIVKHSQQTKISSAAASFLLNARVLSLFHHCAAWSAHALTSALKKSELPSKVLNCTPLVWERSTTQCINTVHKHSA